MWWSMAGWRRSGGRRRGELFDDVCADPLGFCHRYEVDPKFIPTLEKHGLVFSGKHPSQPIMQILELPKDVHPFFVGTQVTGN